MIQSYFLASDEQDYTPFIIDVIFPTDNNDEQSLSVDNISIHSQGNDAKSVVTPTIIDQNKTPTNQLTN